MPNLHTAQHPPTPTPTPAPWSLRSCPPPPPLRGSTGDLPSRARTGCPRTLPGRLLRTRAGRAGPHRGNPGNLALLVRFFPPCSERTGRRGQQGPSWRSVRLNGWLLVPTAPASEPWTRRPVLSAFSHFEAKTGSQGAKARAQGRQEGRQPLEAATGCQRRTSMAQDGWDPEPQAPTCSRWAPEPRPARPADASNPGQEDPLPWRAEERGEKVRSAAPLGALPGGWASAECGWDFSGREEGGPRFRGTGNT